MTDSLVRELVARYLAGDVPVGQLADRLPDGWQLDEIGDDALRSLVLRVLGQIAEFEAGDLRESELRQRLAPFASYYVETYFSGTGMSISSSSKTEMVQSFGADTAPAEAFA